MWTKTTKTLICMLALLVMMTGSAKAVVVVDDFDAAGLDPMWTLNDDPGSYVSGGGFAHGAGHLRFNNIFENGYGHIETTVDTTNGARVDAIMRQDHFGTVNWGLGAGFYYDANNWASLKLIAAGGVNDGWSAMVMDNGVLTQTELQTSEQSPRFWWRIGGVEVTATQVKFWGSTPKGPPDFFAVGAAGIDPNVTVLLSIARPAAFSGNATAIIGKGFTGAGAPNPDFDNIGSTTSGGFAGIDLVRITTTPVPEPATIGLLALGGLVMLGRSRRKRA